MKDTALPPEFGGYVREITLLDSKNVIAISVRANQSKKGTGKIWRKAIYVLDEKSNDWDFLCEVRKTTTWRGPSFKVDYFPNGANGRAAGKWCDSWFNDEADAEKFMDLTWEFFV